MVDTYKYNLILMLLFDVARDGCEDVMSPPRQCQCIYCFPKII